MLIYMQFKGHICTVQRIVQKYAEMFFARRNTTNGNKCKVRGTECGVEKDLVGIAKPQAVLCAKVSEQRLGIFHVHKPQ